MWRNSTTSGGIVLRRFVSASISPVFDDLDDLVLDRGADPRQLLGRSVERELGDRRAGLAHARGGPAVGDHPEGGLALDLEQVGQQLELLGHIRVAGERLRHDSDHRGVKAVVCLPTYNERENLERMVDALADKGVSVLVIDDSSPDGTGELADRLAAEHDHVEVLHRPRKEGLGPAYLAGFRARAGRPGASSSCSRWTRTSRTTRPTCRA